MNTLTFNGKNSWVDFNAYLNYFQPSYPSPQIISITIPYMSGSYDFSTTGSNGEQVFTDRTVNFSLEFIELDQKKLIQIYNSVIDWLFGDGQKHELIYSIEPDMCYKAKVVEISSFENLVTTGQIKGSFLAEPFKYGIEYVQDNWIWDIFNFEEDIIQTLRFDVNGTLDITINNVSRTSTPVIISDSNFNLIKDGITYNIVSGENNLFNFRLKNGENNIRVLGTGNIEFKYKKVKL